MKRAKRISPGDTLSLIAPASPFNRAIFSQAKRWLERRGYGVEYLPGIFSRQDYLAGSDDRRLSELSRAFASNSKAVFCARGGYGVMRLFLHKRPKMASGKLFMGMSDLTPLLNTYAKDQKTVSIHGPVLAGKLFMGLGESAKGRLFSLLEDPQEQVLRSGVDFQTHVNGSFSGRLWGGNLCLVASTLATKATISPGSSSVLYLEEVEESPYRVDRMLTQLALSGFLSKFSAILLGDFTDSKGRRFSGKSLEALIRGVLGKQTPPLLSGIASSHVRMKVLLPIGGEVRHHRGTLILSPLVS